ncbi:hypothetical protein Cgig2_015246 [Carnegiea gigantea]|uniref:Glucose-methanol-choline oxidoreductase N-terminal domain-containing protein n=1 Tax=Carnegiea gigantea TaxID=171969 RepID=A0A9Q1QLW4_9CARY|nr:hypothetical protein Cgig2_015246 [Carnegiea gigantea]
MVVPPCMYAPLFASFRWVLVILMLVASFSFSTAKSPAAPAYLKFTMNATAFPPEEYYDYVIVGGGTSGCPLAATLSQNYNVLLLERGGVPYGKPDLMTQEGHYHHAMVRENGEVILSAGSVGSPQLLLLSGVGSKPYLSSWGIPVAHHLPYVGQFLYDNPRNGRSLEEFKFTTWYGNRNFRFLGPSLPMDLSDDTLMGGFCRRTVSTIWHYHGGCLVGKVVDRDLQVIGINALRVVDGSILTISPGTNPQATLLMLGRYMGLKLMSDRTRYDESCKARGFEQKTQNEKLNELRERKKKAKERQPASFRKLVSESESQHAQRVAGRSIRLCLVSYKIIKKIFIVSKVAVV